MLKLTQLRAYLSNNALEAVAEDAAQEFIQKGGKVTQLPYRKPRKSEKTDYGSKHIGGSGEHKSGKAANTQSPRVVGEEILGEEDYDTMVDRMGSPSAVRRHFRGQSGASQSLDQTIARSKASSAGRASGKLYHKVPFHQKDDAKKEGMRWDSDARKWYHSSPAASSSSKFQKEEVELDEKTLTPAEMSKREEIAKAMERKHPGMDKAKKMAIATATAKRVAEESDQIDELKQTTLSRYASKARSLGMQGGDKSIKRLAGAKRATQKLKYGDYSEETELIDEISKATAKSYADKRSTEINYAPEMPFKKKPRDKAYANRTAQGMISALKRMHGQKPTSEETEQVDELNKDTLYSYKKKADADYETQGRKIGPLIRANDAAGANKAATRTNKRLMGMERAEKRLGEEAVKTTHGNPLVTVHAGDKLHTHANLSTANSILGTSVKAADVHKGEVKTKGRDYSDLRFNISKHHQAALKESVQLSELTYKLLRRYKSAASKDASAADSSGDYARGNKRFSGIIKATKKQFQIGAKDPKATMDETTNIDEISQATTTSYVNKVVDPVYGMPRSTSKMKQRLAGLERIRQRTAKKYSEKSQEVKEEQDTNQMSSSVEKKAFIKIKPTRSAAVAKALK